MKHSDLQKKTGGRSYKQTSGNELLLKRIQERRRGLRNPRIVVRKYKTKIRLIVSLISLALLGYFLYKYVYLSPKFLVSKVSIVGTGKFVNAEDFRVVCEQRFVRKSIFSVSTEDSMAALKENFPGAKNIEISKDYPNTIIVKVEERVPLALIRSNQNQQYYLVDKEGYVLGEISTGFEELPKIIYEGEVRTGMLLSGYVVPVSVEILSEAGKAGLDVSSVSFRERYSMLYLGPTKVFISNSKDIKESISALEKLYKSLLLEGKSIAKIDLRYDKVIVLYE